MFLRKKSNNIQTINSLKNRKKLVSQKVVLQVVEEIPVISVETKDTKKKKKITEPIEAENNI